MEKEAAADVVRQFFVKICGIMFKPVSWYQHIGGNYHRYPAGMVKNSLRDFSPDAGFEYRMPEKELKRRRTFAYILLLALMILVPGFMILRINGAQTYFSCCWQF